METPPDADLLRLARPGDVLLLDVDGLAEDTAHARLGQLAHAAVPTIALSSDRSVELTIALLEAGADDHLAKPLSVDELVARVRSVRRRSDRRPRVRHHVRVEGLELDLDSHTVLVQGRSVSLTSTEWRLLEELVRNAGTVLGHTHLATAVWGHAQPTDTRSLRVHISNLRRKLGEPGAALIATDHGLGYRWKGPTPEPR